MSKSGQIPIKPKYKRIVLKLSGEFFKSEDSRMSIDPLMVTEMAKRIKTIYNMGVEIGVVVGGGNIFRGANTQTRGIDRATGDYMGMLATIINAMALQNALEHMGIETRLQTAIEMPKVAEPFILRRALRHLEKGRIVIFGGGTGNPYVSTDTAAALRASEIGADVLLKATKVKGIYSADPVLNPDAVKYTKLTFDEAISKSIRIMDTSAFSMCRENHIPIIVFSFWEKGSLEAIIMGKRVGTLVTEK